VELSADKLIQLADRITIYQPLPVALFKDKERIKYFTQRNRSAKRVVDSRSKLIDLKGKSVLDVGCNIGYFAWNHLDKFKTYTGIDNDLVCIQIANLIKREIGREDLLFKCSSIQELQKKSKKYDVCLFLSVYHHLIHACGYIEARKILQKISEISKELYFDMGQKNEHTNSARKKWHDLLPDKDPYEFILNEVFENSDYVCGQAIGESCVTHSKRILFRFTR